MTRPPEIPIIDVSDMLANNDASARSRVAAQIENACTGTGFFYVSGHGVPGGLIKEAFEANVRFHEKPMEEKLRIKQNKWHRGYQAFASSTLKSSARFPAARHPNQLESFFLRHEVAEDHPDFMNKPLQGPNQWPDDPWFVDVVKRYDEAVRRLGHQLLPAFSLAVGEDEGFFGKLFDPPSTTLRLIHYPPAPETREEDLYGIYPHTDYGFLTILSQDDVGGLQIQRVDGTWIDAPYIPDTFILNIGDILARWTNDKFNSTPHRVINKSSNRDRYSVAMFFDPNLESTVSTLPRFADAQTNKYEDIRYADYFTLRLDANYPDRAGLEKTA
ncbi:isopenicillin N synthase family dioxygenase [Aquibaculum sediminis]|uniref:isopenicillin N synthase family dioxygenase n=1 Tax=Aquibaculum sediminis TaxID=3231907 RepID=UPI0034559547